MQHGADEVAQWQSTSPAGRDHKNMMILDLDRSLKAGAFYVGGLSLGVAEDGWCCRCSESRSSAQVRSDFVLAAGHSGATREMQDVGFDPGLGFLGLYGVYMASKGQLRVLLRQNFVLMPPSSSLELEPESLVSGAGTEAFPR